MAWVRCCGGARPKFPFDLLNQIWDYKPNINRTVASSGETTWTMLSKTPTLTGNILSVTLYRPSYAEVRVDYSTDNGATWAQLVVATTVGASALYTANLSAYTGQQLMIRVRVNTYGTGGTFAPVTGDFVIA